MGHYYELTGSGVEPRHFVGVSSRPGELRPTTLRDARKFGWTPSVTTVMQMLDKPALNDWRITEHLKAAYALREEAGMTEQETWIQYVKDSTQFALAKAPQDGTDFHDLLEQFFSGEQITGKGMWAYCLNVRDSIQDNTKLMGSFNPEKTFVHELGFAGKVDLHIGGAWVIDFKTKNTVDKWKPGKMAYSEHAMQLAAYRVGLGLDNARCANVFICLEDGAVEFHEWDNAELDKQWANFADLLRIWLRNAGYVPGLKFTKAAS